MTTLKSECRKFSPNIFNKIKCQNCFRTKEAHSAEALESNRSTRKVSKCGYVFVAPDWDFSVSINRTKRWQRRWFVLYDDGELTYSVDEHPDTVPQAVIDMNMVLEVTDAQEITGNQYAIAITAPEKVHFVKGTSREESKWWFDVLSRIPRNNLRHLSKHKRNATFPGGKATTSPVMSDHESVTAESYCTTDEVIRPRFTSESVISQQHYDNEWNDWLHHQQQQLQDDDVFPTKDCDGDIDTSGRAPVADDDDADIKNLVNEEDDSNEKNELDSNKKLKLRRYQKRENRSMRSQRSRSDGVSKMIPTRDTILDNKILLGLSANGDERLKSPIPVRRRHTSDKIMNWSDIGRNMESKKAPEKNIVAPSVPASRGLKKSESLMNISSEISQEMKHHISELKRNYSYKSPMHSKRKEPHFHKDTNAQPFIQPVRDAPPKSQVINNSNNLEAVGNAAWDLEVDICTESLVLKKGWLFRRPTLLIQKEEWSRHWFVLKNASFTYYRDPSAKDCGILDGVLDLNQVTSVEQVETDRHYAFCIAMWDNKKHILSALTPASRSSWIKSIQCASNLWDAESRRDFSNDEIVLPDHHNTSNSSEKNPNEHTHDQSSSDDQSEYFSIIDDGEEDGVVDKRPPSPRTLPPSPPVNRTAMSLVKERSRGRSNSYSSLSTPMPQEDDEEADVTTIEDNIPVAHSSLQETSSRTSIRSIQRSHSESHAIPREKRDSKADIKLPTKRNPKSEESSATAESKTLFGKSLDANTLERLRSGYQNYSEMQLLKLLSADKVHLPLDVDDYKLKYELLKAKYIQDRTDWEEKSKKEPVAVGKTDSLGAYVKILQKTKRTVYELKEKVGNIDGDGANGTILIAKEFQQVCKELDKLLACVDKRAKREGDVKKWKKGFAELQLVCRNHQKSVQEEKNHNSSLTMELKKRDHTIEELQQEIQSFKEQLSLHQSQKSQDDYSVKNLIMDIADEDINNICNKLSDKLKLSDAHVRMLKKELRESQKSLDDLEISSFQMKQDGKNAEENHRSQMSLMTARIDDLTSKLTASERNCRQHKQKIAKLETKQERRRSSLKNKETLSLSKECEAKLLDLENKISSIENELRPEDRASVREDSSICSEYERTLGKRLSQDSSSSGENAGSLLLRLHSLGMRTKSASESVKKLNVASNDTIPNAFDNPKICLQVRNDEEIMGHDEEEEEECGEDWSTLSYTTSLTDLQTFDGIDGCEYPNTWSEVVECLEHKLESLMSWLKSSVQGLQKQESIDGHSMTNPDFFSLSSTIFDSIENFNDGDNNNDPSTSKVHLKALLLNDVVKDVQKVANFESTFVLEKLCACRQVFKLISQHLQRLSDIEHSVDVSPCSSLVEKLLSTCCTTYDVFLGDSLDDFTQVSQQSPSRLHTLKQNCHQLLQMLQESQLRQFSGILQTLADIPVQDPEVSSGKNSVIMDDLLELDPLLSNLIDIITHLYNVVKHEISELHQDNLTLLQCEYEAWKALTRSLLDNLSEEQNSLIAELKQSYPQVREKYTFSCSISEASYKKIIHGGVSLARITILKAVSQSLYNFLQEESTSSSNLSDSKLWVKKLKDRYCSSESSSSFSESTCPTTESWEILFSNHIVDNGIQRTKTEAVLHELHQKKIDNLCKEIETLTNDNNKLKTTCETTKLKFHDLQEKMKQLTVPECCSECHILKAKLHTMVKLHEADLFALDRKCKDKMEEIHKHLQLVLEQKDEIHSQEVQKLEQQLQTAQTVSSRLEVEYSQQIQHLKEIYQQKVFVMPDPINEESVRRRYHVEIKQLKDLWGKALSAVQNTYQQMTVEINRRHKQEILLLEADKEKILKEEAQATVTALEVLRKHHAEELQREITRCKEEFLMRQGAAIETDTTEREKHGSELESVKSEIMSLSEKYSVKCLESASLEEQIQILQQQLQEASHQLFDLTARNKQLKVHLAMDSAETKQLLNDNFDQDETVENLKALLSLKENEIVQQKEDNAEAKQELHLAQMHVSLLDVQCEQLYQSLHSERKLREDEVNNLRSRLEAIMNVPLVHGDELNLEPRNTSKPWHPGRNILSRSPSLVLPSSSKQSLDRLSYHHPQELLRSPSWPGVECSK